MEDGDEVGEDCPKCDTPLVFAIAIQDGWNYSNDRHTTTEIPMMVCNNCKYQKEYEPEEPSEPEHYMER